MFYDDIRRVCDEKDTKPSIILKELNMSTGNMSKWKHGTSPTVDIAVKLAHHLGVSLSYLCAPEDILEVKYPEEFAPWIEVIERIPEERRQMCLDFLKTHMVVPEKFTGKMAA